jgi:hypothetical protein
MGPPKGAHNPGSVVEGFIIFVVAYFVVVQFVLPRFGIRPG